jgi:hypothetical protein
VQFFVPLLKEHFATSRSVRPLIFKPAASTVFIVMCYFCTSGKLPNQLRVAKVSECRLSLSHIPQRSASHPLSLKSTSILDIVPSSQSVETNELAKDPFQSIQRRLEMNQVIYHHRHNLDLAILLPTKTSSQSIAKMCEEAFGNCIDACFAKIDKTCDETVGDWVDRCCSLPLFGKENQETYQKILKAKKIAKVKLQLEKLQSAHPHDTDAMKEWRAKEIVKTKVELADVTGEEPPSIDPLQLPLMHEFELQELDAVSIIHFSLALHSLFSWVVEHRVIYISARACCLLHILPQDTLF